VVSDNLSSARIHLKNNHAFLYYEIGRIPQNSLSNRIEKLNANLVIDDMYYMLEDCTECESELKRLQALEEVEENFKAMNY
jgi:uncharacterized protein YkvS